MRVLTQQLDCLGRKAHSSENGARLDAPMMDSDCLPKDQLAGFVIQSISVHSIQFLDSIPLDKEQPPPYTPR